MHTNRQRILASTIVTLASTTLVSSLFLLHPSCPSHAAGSTQTDINPAPSAASKQKANPSKSDVYHERKQIYESVAESTDIPWYFLAAIDQFERNILLSKKDRPKELGLIGITIPPERWAGLNNPDPQDENLITIATFGGMGMDGSSDGRASAKNPLDAIYTMGFYLLRHGTDETSLRSGLKEYYGNDKSVEMICNYARMYQTLDRLDLEGNVFPLPKGSNYTLRNTWGAARNWGGRRSHEGTDIFAASGTPVRSTSYGYVEVMGWNPLGGWRVGIRDLNNVYHYYAHLAGYSKSLKQGNIVQPGEAIGWVGSSGYGKQGTSGKFPPHLHYGMYRFTGQREWAFDPYPYLRKWERSTKK